jgi:hypothetical protein
MTDHRLTALKVAVRRNLGKDPRRRGQIITPEGKRIASPCEGQSFRPHRCWEPLEMNEVIVTRRVFQKLPAVRQMHFFHRINCSINCRFFHTRFGHTRAYRLWFVERMADIYGWKSVEFWMATCPLKIKPRRRETDHDLPS